MKRKLINTKNPITIKTEIEARLELLEKEMISLKLVFKESESIIIKKDEYLIMRFDIKENLTPEFMEILINELRKNGIKGIIIPSEYPINISTVKQE